MLVAAEWLKSGIPTKVAGTKRTRDEAFNVQKIVTTIKQPGFLREDAERIINALRSSGFIDNVIYAGSDTGAQDFVEFMTRFWDYEVSPYVKEKNAHGHRIGMRHCYECTLRLKRHWTPYFKGRQIGTITKKDLKAFALHVAESGLAKATINQILNVGFVPLKWAHDNEIIKEDPTVGVMRFSGEPSKRGVLTETEADQLFKVQWNDERACIASLVAATTGLRAGEIRALRLADVEDNKLQVRRAWSKIDGEKSTKTNKERTVPLIPSVRDALRALEAKNSGPSSYSSKTKPTSKSASR
jgi:site-specific recombinase XerD